MKTAQKLRVKGFTLIELLVVIAVLGILAAVVLVAINPSERINEANDAGVKNDVSQVASAVESCFTNNEGEYDNCLTGTALTGSGYLKLMPSGASINPTTGSPANVVVYGTLSAASAGTCAGPSLNYWVYRSATGSSEVECLAAAPTP